MSENSAELLVNFLRERGETIGTCESLTAGLLAATIAQVPGASEVLRGGIVTYATDLKSSLADVPAELIDEYGVVSAPVAAAMAAGAQQRLGVDWAVGLTGVAGPDDQEGHPPGVVFLGIAGPGGVSSERVLPTQHLRWAIRPGAAEPEQVVDGSRNEIRCCCVEYALGRVVELGNKT
ncbi:CinA family protein [Corynebacterium epidermidicanis]|uniref:Competence/damage-inducible protein CinA-like protein n=1 Tax=Corynebacterium epidermidicanis TaxID=1050174 RepID=A0A0G3GS14_9CORY|nr:CinA family protein [Corynebacterium epidermidicanis]AKK03355.1 competence/damage-inducible protein CinA-like protein [Corynebacterium epidermidicanis]